MRQTRTAAILATSTAAALLATGCSSNDTKPDNKPTPAATRPSTTAAPQPAGPKKTATITARTAAATILHANVKHYRDTLTAGRRTWGTPQFGPWQTKTLTDLSYQQAFTKADHYFTADTEPNSMNSWRDDIATATDQINQWAQKNTIDTAAQPAPSSRDAEAALAKADQDADHVAAGK